MSLYLSDKKVKNLWLGDSKIKNMWLGTNKIHSLGESYALDFNSLLTRNSDGWSYDVNTLGTDFPAGAPEKNAIKFAIHFGTTRDFTQGYIISPYCTGIDSSNSRLWVRHKTDEFDRWEEIPFNKYYVGVTQGYYEFYLIQLNGGGRIEYIFKDTLIEFASVAYSPWISSMAYMFAESSNLQCLDLSLANSTKSIIDINHLLYNSSKLYMLEMFKDKTNELTSMNSAFKGAYNLCNLDLTSLSIASGTDIEDALPPDCDNRNIIFGNSMDFMVMMDMGCGNPMGNGGKYLKEWSSGLYSCDFQLTTKTLSYIYWK